MKFQQRKRSYDSDSADRSKRSAWMHGCTSTLWESAILLVSRAPADISTRSAGKADSDVNHPWHMGDLPNLQSCSRSRQLECVHNARPMGGPTGLFDADGSAIIIHQISIRWFPARRLGRLGRSENRVRSYRTVTEDIEKYDLDWGGYRLERSERSGGSARSGRRTRRPRRRPRSPSSGSCARCSSSRHHHQRQSGSKSSCGDHWSGRH